MIQAVPTEYQGVLFRSKSEAVLARAFDMLAEQSAPMVWIYEPKHWLDPISGYIPDFEVTLRLGNGQKAYMVIEYKPAKVAGAYKKNLTERYRRLHERAALAPSASDTNFLLVSGSVFSGVMRAEEYSPTDGFTPIEVSWLSSRLFEQARSFRFDLEGAA